MIELKHVRVAVLFGGKSAEHEVSVNSGLLATQSLAKTFTVCPVYLDKGGRWHLSERGFEEPSAGTAALALTQSPGIGLPPGEALYRLRSDGTSIAFLALHGPYGEDGRIQGFLELGELPYTGSPVLGSALAMNKDMTKRLYLQAGLPVAAWRRITRGEVNRSPGLILEAGEAVGHPLVVKPTELGSSVGMSICRQRADLPALVAKAFEHGDSVLLEAYIKGQDLTCAVLELGLEGALCALPPTLIRPRSSEFFDYAAKYQLGGSEELTPAPIAPELLARLQSLAVQAHALLQLRGYSKSDFMERDGELFLLETNTLPGLTRTSLLPQAAQAAGIDFDTLLVHLVCVALRLPSPVDSIKLQHTWSPPLA